MAANRRYRNVEWEVGNERGECYPGIKHGCFLAVLMDIRDELQRLNALLHCPNFTNIPTKLDEIKRNTAKPKRKKARP